MDIRVSYYSAIGSRPNNEDAVSVREGQKGLLALVADGLGGHAKGDVAANSAIAQINQLLLDQAPEENALIDAIQAASDHIFDLQTQNEPMRTTIAALWISEETALVANVGDSRIYQFRNGKIIYQSTDHSVAQIAVMAGEIQPSAIRNNPDRNKLIRVLGCDVTPKVDFESLEILSGDRILICSDGFWEPVTEETMCQTSISSQTAKQWLESMKRIIDQAQNPTQDNHSAIALIVHP